MKKLFTNRAFVIIVSAILIVASTVLSTRSKLGGKADDVTEIFYADPAGGRSIASLLQELGSQAALLSAIAADYGVDAEDFSYEVDWLDMALRYNRGDESYICSEYNALMKSYQNVRRLLDSAALSDTDRAQADKAIALIDADSAEITSLASDYNAQVRSFNRRYGNPLATFMAEFAGVEMPEEFK